MTSQIYRDVILEQHVRLFRSAMGAHITRMDWPAFSPDLNLVEHVWDMLGRRVAARQLTCPPELRRALLFEWCNIPQDQIDNLILSIPRRCADRIASSGRHTMKIRTSEIRNFVHDPEGLRIIIVMKCVDVQLKNKNIYNIIEIRETEKAEEF
ncbi:Transposable element Tc1 transposase, partial [Stegodyphus mimosarum]